MYTPMLHCCSTLASIHVNAGFVGGAISERPVLAANIRYLKNASLISEGTVTVRLRWFGLGDYADDADSKAIFDEIEAEAEANAEDGPESVQQDLTPNSVAIQAFSPEDRLGFIAFIEDCTFEGACAFVCHPVTSCGQVEHGPAIAPSVSSSAIVKRLLTSSAAATVVCR